MESGKARLRVKNNWVWDFFFKAMLSEPYKNSEHKKMYRLRYCKAI